MNLSRLGSPDQATDFLGMTGRHVRSLATAGVGNDLIRPDFDLVVRPEKRRGRV